ncbi:MAG: sorbosone dehydrogenase family protein [Microscillaceae bacterium]
MKYALPIYLLGLFLSLLACQPSQKNKEKAQAATDTTPDKPQTETALAPQDLPLQQIKLPKGFSISIFAQVENARSLCQGDKGTIFVGTRRNDKVYALRDEDGDQVAEKVYVIAKGLDTPNGVAFRKGSLFVAEVNRILRFDDIEARLENPPAPVVVNDKLPTEKWHGWKFIAFGPDDKLYVPVGAPCNVCEREEEIFATISRMNPDGSDLEVFARGVRNSVGFDWHPQTKQLWFTNNGRDWLGDDSPDDALYHAPKAGLHFGFPYCHAGDTPDPEFGKKQPCTDFTAPAQKLGPHVAAVGMRFYEGAQFPEKYRGQIFIAKHGSWNRSRKSGYNVSLVVLDGNKPILHEVFAEGWLNEATQEAWGRPVDVLVLPDGSLLVSDDFANVIYRIAYQKPA